MIRLTQILEHLSSVVGWRQSYNPDMQIAEDLIKSESGLFFQGAHPLLTLDNVRSVMPEDWNTQYPEWASDVAYVKGDKVRKGSDIWEAVSANVGSEPPSANWTKYNPLSDYLRVVTKEGIVTAVQRFLQGKQLTQESRSLLERRTFFDGAARLQSIITPTGKIVGFEIVPVRALGVTTKIERIGLQARGAVGKVRFYLFHSSQVAPIRVLDFDYTNTSGGFQWFTPSEDVYLPYIGSDTDAGGAWFLCYNQNALPNGLFALNVSKDWSKEPCQTCYGYNIDAYRELTKYLQVSPFCTKAPADFQEHPEMFDPANIAYTNTMNYGLNLEISVGCDLTDFIISQRGMFANVIQKQVAASILRTMALNPAVRVNRNQVNVTRDELLYEIDGNPQGRKSGIAVELEAAYKALSLDTRNLDRICLQCNNHGVKYRTL